MIEEAVLYNASVSERCVAARLAVLRLAVLRLAVLRLPLPHREPCLCEGPLTYVM